MKILQFLFPLLNFDIFKYLPQESSSTQASMDVFSVLLSQSVSRKIDPVGTYSIDASVAKTTVYSGITCLRKQGAYTYTYSWRGVVNLPEANQLLNTSHLKSWTAPKFCVLQNQLFWLIYHICIMKNAILGKQPGPFRDFL